MVTELIELYDLEVRVRLMKSEESLADVLTRVSRSWLQTQVCAVGCASTYSISAIRDLHDTKHLGSEKTLHLAKCKWGDAVVKEDIARVVREYDVCRQVNPAPVNWENGKLSVETTKTRLASDITVCNGVPFLTVIDCGPSRFLIWRQLRNETSEFVVTQLEQLFHERGPPKELLTNNGPC